MKLHLLILLLLGIWIGMLIGISFVEAPLKFRAPNITLPLGLGIGKIVFSALNKFELTFSVGLLFWIIKEYKHLDLFPTIVLGVLIFLVMLQTVWLIPILNARADAIIGGAQLAKSNHHFYYVGMEVVKLIALLYSFVKTYSFIGN